MKKTIAAITALIAACALCCIPLFIPAMAGASFFGLQLFRSPLSLEAILCAVVPAIIVAMAAYMLLRLFAERRKKAGCGNTTCSTAGKCGCS